MSTGPEGGSRSPSTPLRLEDVARSWWIPLVSGLLNLLAALIILTAPHSSLVAIAFIIGIYLVLAGAIALGGAFGLSANRGIVITLASLAIVAGIFVMFRPGSAVHGVRIVLGIYLVISGLAHLSFGALVGVNRGRETLVGALELIAGIVFLAAPKLGLAALALFIGIYLLMRAAMEIALALALRRAR